MWLFTTRGFYSVVADRQQKGNVLIRARCKTDAWNLYRRFKDRYRMTRPKSDLLRDYRWRISMKRSDFARLAACLAREITYSNFKDEVHERKDQTNKSSAYLTIWGTMMKVQRAEEDAESPVQERFWEDDWHPVWNPIWRPVQPEQPKSKLDLALEQLKPEQTEERYGEAL